MEVFSPRELRKMHKLPKYEAVGNLKARHVTYLGMGNETSGDRLFVGSLAMASSMSPLLRDSFLLPLYLAVHGVDVSMI
jgi:hypothetical protein